MSDKFTLIWHGKDGSEHVEKRNSLMNADFESAILRLTRGPAALAGFITKVVVIDQDDYTNFLWENGKVVFPTKDDIEEFDFLRVEAD